MTLLISKLEILLDVAGLRSGGRGRGQLRGFICG